MFASKRKEYGENGKLYIDSSFKINYTSKIIKLFSIKKNVFNLKSYLYTLTLKSQIFSLRIMLISRIDNESIFNMLKISLLELN